MKTLQQMLNAGFERVACHSQRRNLVQGKRWRIVLSDGVNGSGLQTGKIVVFLLQRSNWHISGWETHSSRDVAVTCETISDLPSRMHDYSFADFVKTAEIDAACEELRKVGEGW